ncbi:MAG: ATP-dependent DNA helicase RecG [Verrucomicrobia bacterium]|nr:ATP-dependent DNA helicase RecG [Verrucomicrobiota bacterium]
MRAPSSSRVSSTSARRSTSTCPRAPRSRSSRRAASSSSSAAFSSSPRSPNSTSRRPRTSSASTGTVARTATRRPTTRAPPRRPRRTRQSETARPTQRAHATLDPTRLTQSLRGAMAITLLDEPIQQVKGVGPARARLLDRLGIRTVRDALWHCPRAYNDRRTIMPIGRCADGEHATVTGTITSVRRKRYTWRRSVVTVKLDDGTGALALVWFNQPYLRDQFKRGERLVAAGAVKTGSNDELQIVQPEWEQLGDDAEAPDDDAIHLRRIVPVYPLTEGLPQKVFRRLMFGLVHNTGALPDPLPPELRAAHGLPAFDGAIREVHFPTSFEAIQAARRRLIFEEFFVLQLGVAIRRRTITQFQKPRPERTRCLAAQFLERLPFELTAAQRRVLDEIERDLARPSPMNRLLQGDVGSGKTVVAIAAALHACDAGRQAAIMAPTEVLAHQHAGKLAQFLDGLPLRIALLVGGMPARERRPLHEAIRSGAIDVVVGTHALFQERVTFKQLGLVVIDEQHKFGVMQRLRLLKKAEHPDVLALSATPIPRTLSLTLYGDMDVSVLDELPPNRHPIATRWLRNSKLPQAFALVQRELDAGRQAYVVYPIINENPELELKAAKEMHAHLRRDVFRGRRVGLLYGPMPADEKDGVMQCFARGELDVLVSTTVIEVGVDVPNATVMLVENAGRFGLAQLHQLRGRVGRGAHKSTCLLVDNPKTDTGRERLRIIESTSDGFRLAEEDLRMRGCGEFFGTRQSGLPELRLGDPLRDMELMQLARDEARRVVDGDLPISDEVRALLRAELRRRYAGRLRLVTT